jgi:fructokinase
MAKTLADERVDVTWMRLDPAHRTSTVVVDLDDHGERSFTFMVRPSADLFLEPADLPTFSAGEWLHVCSIALSAEPSRSATFQAMAAIREAGGYVSFDPNIRPDLWPDENALRRCLEQALQSADVVKLSVEELAFFTGSAEVNVGLEVLMQRCPARLVLVTQGKEGVIAWHEGSRETLSGNACAVRRYDRCGRCLCGGAALRAGRRTGPDAGYRARPALRRWPPRPKGR